MTTVSRLKLNTQGRAIVEQHGGKWANGSGMCRCPAHQDGSPSLSVRLGDTSLLFHCFAGCDTLDVLRELRRGGHAGGMLRTDEARAPASGNMPALIERLWRDSHPLTRSPAAAYLAGRGLASHSAQLRYHHRVQLGPTAEATFHPALLAAVRDDSGLVAVHRTFLDPVTNGKAAIDMPKRLLGLPAAGAVRLGQPGRVLGLAEGIETALAATALHDIPVWAVLGNERFGMVAIPPHVETLVILADHDLGGQRAAKRAQALYQRDNLDLRVIWPPAPHNDWADVLAAT